MLKTIFSKNFKVRIYNKVIKYTTNDLKHLLEIKDYEKALKVSQKMIKDDPKLFEAHFSKGMALANLKRRKESITAFSMALKCKSTISQEILALNNKGIQYLEIKKNKEALKCFNKTLKLNPNDFEAQFNIGNIFAFEKMNEKALVFYHLLLNNLEKTIVQKGDPILFNVYVNIALTNMELEKYEEAVKYFDLALNLLKTAKDDDDISVFIFRHLSQIYFKKGFCLNELKRYDEARMCYMQGEQLK